MKLCLTRLHVTREKAPDPSKGAGVIHCLPELLACRERG
jgi:hypothetical protein